MKKFDSTKAESRHSADVQGEETESDGEHIIRDQDLDFRPIRIKGEPLSETIIRERREGY